MHTAQIKKIFYIDNSRNGLKKQIVLFGCCLFSFYNRKHVTKISKRGYTRYMCIDNKGAILNRFQIKCRRTALPNIDDTRLLCEIRKLDNFTYIPNPGNMGDMLIAAATIDWFNRNSIQYTMYSGKSDKNIVYGGGGIWTATYKDAWMKFLEVFRTANRVVILPSSFNDCPELIDALDERFVVFCRERKSYDYLMSAKTKATIILDNDMAFRLTSKYIKKAFYLSDYSMQIFDKITALPEKDIVYFSRTDSESVGHYYSDLDLSLMVYGDEYVTPNAINEYAKMMLMTVNQFSAVVTDRLHVAIAAALLNKQVYLLDNSYGKCWNVFKHSMQKMKHVHFCRTIA